MQDHTASAIIAKWQALDRPVIFPDQKEINSTLSEIEEVERSVNATLVNMVDPSRLALLHGKWTTLATTLPLPAVLPIQAIVPNINPNNSITIHVEAIDQEIDLDRGLYNNIVSFVLSDDPEGRQHGLFSVITRADFTKPDHFQPNNRLNIIFYQNELRCNNTEGLTALQHRLGMDHNEDWTKSPLKRRGHSDVIFLDEQGRVRVMKGNMGHIYLLKRL